MAHGTMNTLETVDGAPEGLHVGWADWGEQKVTVVSVAKGFDMATRMAALQDGACQVPHWGYCVRGSFRVRYADGGDETIGAGEAFYMPPGHVPEYLEDCELVEFSPADLADEQREKLMTSNASS